MLEFIITVNFQSCICIVIYYNICIYKCFLVIILSSFFHRFFLIIVSIYFLWVLCYSHNSRCSYILACLYACTLRHYVLAGVWQQLGHRAKGVVGTSHQVVHQTPGRWSCSVSCIGPITNSVDSCRHKSDFFICLLVFEQNKYILFLRFFKVF